MAGLRALFLLLALILATPAAVFAAVYQPVDSLEANAAKDSDAPSTVAERKGAEAPKGKQRLFGTVEFGRDLQSLPIWLDVLKRNLENPIFQPEKYFNKQTTWKNLRERGQGKSDLEKLRIVNAFWNRWPYHEDRVNWGKADYWAIPAQFLKKSGDCEDYSIIKYFTLKEMGIDPRNMRIVVLRDTVRNLAHAVLAVYLADDIYILDNLSNVVLSHNRIRNYLPQYSVNEFGRWAHIKPGSKRKQGKR